jgi:type VI secretion system secreted protein VgrG
MAVPAVPITFPRRRALTAMLLAGVATTGLLLASVVPVSAAAAVGLGTADSFAVLAGSGITNTGPTTITGDVGTFPTPSETGFSSVTLTGSSTDHAGDAVTQGAKPDLVTAYNDAAGRLPASQVQVELGNTTLLAGVYTSPTFGLTGTLTLDGQGDPDAEFVFQAGSTITTAADSRVLLINGANACHVTWQIGSSATFGTGTKFVGDVLAQESITATTEATFEGRLLARDGAVTLDTNTITRSTCASSAGGTAGTGTSATPTSSGTVAPTTVTGGAEADSTGGAATNGASTTGATTASGTTGSATSRTGTPAVASPRSPGAPSTPGLAVTGFDDTLLLVVAFALLGIGRLALIVSRPPSSSRRAAHAFAGRSMSSCSNANAAAAVRVVTPSLVKMFER